MNDDTMRRLLEDVEQMHRETTRLMTEAMGLEARVVKASTEADEWKARLAHLIGRYHRLSSIGNRIEELLMAMLGRHITDEDETQPKETP